MPLEVFLSVNSFFADFILMLFLTVYWNFLTSDWRPWPGALVVEYITCLEILFLWLRFLCILQLKTKSGNTACLVASLSFNWFFSKSFLLVWNFTWNPHSIASAMVDAQVVGADGSTVNKMKRAQAEQIARDKNLKLVLVNKGNESQPVSYYRLMTSAEYRTQMKELKQVKRLEKLPDLKTLKLNSSIAERDLQIKVSQVVEWIQAGHSVKVAIMSSRKSTVSVFRWLHNGF